MLIGEKNKSDCKNRAEEQLLGEAKRQTTSSLGLISGKIHFHLSQIKSRDIAESLNCLLQSSCCSPALTTSRPTA